MYGDTDAECRSLNIASSARFVLETININTSFTIFQLKMIIQLVHSLRDGYTRLVRAAARTGGAPGDTTGVLTFGGSGEGFIGWHGPRTGAEAGQDRSGAASVCVRVSRCACVCHCCLHSPGLSCPSLGSRPARRPLRRGAGSSSLSSDEHSSSSWSYKVSLSSSSLPPLPLLATSPAIRRMRVRNKTHSEKLTICLMSTVGRGASMKLARRPLPEAGYYYARDIIVI